MKKNAVYYTTNYTWQMINLSLMYMGVNMFARKLFSLRYADEIVLISIIQAVILNGILKYVIFGIKNAEKDINRVILFSAVLIFNITLILLLKENSLSLQCLAGLALSFTVSSKLKRINGDNEYKNNEEEMRYAELKEDIKGVKVLFPVDMGGKYKKEGFIEKVGWAEKGKYKGSAVGLVSAGDKKYICRLRQMRAADKKNKDGWLFLSCEEEILNESRRGREHDGI